MLGALLAGLGIGALAAPLVHFAPVRIGLGLIAAASNPLTILMWAALFAVAAPANVVAGPSSAGAFVAGIGFGEVLGIRTVRVG